MPGFMNNLKTVNSLVRTCLVVGIAGGVGYGGWFGYDKYVKPGLEAEAALAQVAELETQLASSRQLQAELTQQNERMQTSLKLLKTDRRIGEVEILEKATEDDGTPILEVRFTEVDRDGETIGSPRDYTLKGNEFFIDCWIATFEDRYIEEADELRNASIFAFKSIYGDAERPRDAQRLDSDSADAPPGVYDDGRKRAFEQKIWSDFWTVCSDRTRQKELGIRAAYGHANHVVAKAGQRYRITVRASGGVSLTPIELTEEEREAAEEP